MDKMIEGAYIEPADSSSICCIVALALLISRAEVEEIKGEENPQVHDEMGVHPGLGSSRSEPSTYHPAYRFVSTSLIRKRAMGFVLHSEAIGAHGKPVSQCPVAQTRKMPS